MLEFLRCYWGRTNHNFCTISVLRNLHSFKLWRQSNPMKGILVGNDLPQLFVHIFLKIDKHIWNFFSRGWVEKTCMLGCFVNLFQSVKFYWFQSEYLPWMSKNPVTLSAYLWPKFEQNIRLNTKSTEISRCACVLHFVRPFLLSWRA